jgi:hypothetical protein
MEKMSEIDIERKMFMWFIEEVKNLKPNEKEIKIGKYIFTFRYARVRVWLGELYDEVDFPAISSKATTRDLANISMLEFGVHGLYKDYITTVEIYKKEDYTFKMYLYPDRSQESIYELLDAILNEMNKNDAIKKEVIIHKLSGAIYYLNIGYTKAFNEGEDEYIVYTDEMSEYVINPLVDVLEYLIDNENENEKEDEE